MTTTLMQILLVEDSLADVDTTLDAHVDDVLRPIPVAELATSAAESGESRTCDLGASCFLTKPLDLDQFVRVVQSIDHFWPGLVRLPS